MSDTAAAAALTPPSQLTLVAPEPVKQVEPAKAGGMVPIPAAALPALDAEGGRLRRLGRDAGRALAGVHGQGRRRADDGQRRDPGIGRDVQQAARSRRCAPCRRHSETGKVAGTLVDLRRTVEDLDPKQATGVKKLLGMIPFGDKVRDYFHKYESAQSHIDAILKALARRAGRTAQGQRRPRPGEGASLGDDAAPRPVLLRRRASRRGDGREDRRDRADRCRRRRRCCATTCCSTSGRSTRTCSPSWPSSIQGYLAIDLVRKNNLELIKGVDRATTTTISALRTAVIVAQALANQKPRARPDHRAEHHHVEPDRVDVATARHPGSRRSRSSRPTRRSASRRCSARSTTSTSRWTPSTRSRRRPSTR